MKILLSWILDHIVVTRQEIDPDALFKSLNDTTSEIDEVRHIETDLSTLFLGRVIASSSDGMTLDCSELKKQVTIPLRKDADDVDGYWLLVKKEGNQFRSATMVDVGSEKEGLMPALLVDDEDHRGNWRTKVEQEDHCITIDNKALTNRPDLWGHRGFAREVAALLGKELRPEDIFLAVKTIKHFEQRSNGGS